MVLLLWWCCCCDLMQQHHAVGGNSKAQPAMEPMYAPCRAGCCLYGWKAKTCNSVFDRRKHQATRFIACVSLPASLMSASAHNPSLVCLLRKFMCERVCLGGSRSTCGCHPTAARCVGGQALCDIGGHCTPHPDLRRHAYMLLWALVGGLLRPSAWLCCIPSGLLVKPSPCDGLGWLACPRQQQRLTGSRQVANAASLGHHAKVVWGGGAGRTEDCLCNPT